MCVSTLYCGHCVCLTQSLMKDQRLIFPLRYPFSWNTSKNWKTGLSLFCTLVCMIKLNAFHMIFNSIHKMIQGEIKTQVDYWNGPKVKKERYDVNKIRLIPEYLILTIIHQGSAVGEGKKESSKFPSDTTGNSTERNEKHIRYLGTNLLFKLSGISEKCSHRFYIYCIYIYCVYVYTHTYICIF